MADVAIRCKGLGKRYRRQGGVAERLRDLLGRGSPDRDFWAVRDFDLEVPRGAVLGLVGRNGAGKSTVLKMIAGRLTPSTGSVEVEGRVSAILELGTGLNPNLNGFQNARINALFLGLDPWEIEPQLQRVLDFAELGDHVHQPLAHYSSGMRARLAFAVLTALRPDVLILDEALAAGDTAFAAKCQKYVRDLCKSGCTSVVVSHDMGFLEQMCDTIAWVEDGRLRAHGEAHKIIEEYVVTTVGRAAQVRRPRCLLLRLTILDGTTAALGYLSLDDPAGKGLGGVDLGREDGLRATFELAASAGVTAVAARRGWGEPVDVAWKRPLRRLELPAGASALLAVPVPPAPVTLPAGIRLWLAPGARLSVEASVDGVFVPLGQVGGGEPAPHPDDVRQAEAPPYRADPLPLPAAWVAAAEGATT